MDDQIACLGPIKFWTRFGGQQTYGWTAEAEHDAEQ